MTRLVLSSKFTRRDPKLQSKIEETIAQMFEDLANPSLGTHKLEGNLSGLLACSCGYDCRIIFSIKIEEDTGETAIFLLNVGNHDEVY